MVSSITALSSSLLFLLSLYNTADATLVDAEQTCSDGECAAHPTLSYNAPSEAEEFCYEWIRGTGALQEFGFGQVPASVSKQIEETVCDYNEYFLTEVRPKPEHYKLVQNAKECRNLRNLCAFWKTQGQCESEEWKEYMFHACPLACQSCGDTKRRAHVFQKFFAKNLTNAYYGNATDESQETPKRSVVADRNRTLVKLMDDLGMDSALLSRPLRKDDGNWLGDLHRKLFAVIPGVLLGLYGPTFGENESILASIFGDNSTNLIKNLGVQYRDRGTILRSMGEAMDHLVTRPIQLHVSFAVPSQKAVDKLQELDRPMVQMGAGSGYWAALLRNARIDVLAYDLHPPQSGDNVFFDTAYLDDIQQGACVDVFKANPEMATTRTLLMIWPNDPDPIDNPQFAESGSGGVASQAVWDTDCLEAYLEAGGTRVVHIGEREEVIRKAVHDRGHKATSSDWGISSSKNFQQLLAERFRMVEKVEIPTLWLNEDDMTIWERR